MWRGGAGVLRVGFCGTLSSEVIHQFVSILFSNVLSSPSSPLIPPPLPSPPLPPPQIIGSKDSLIRSFQHQLKSKDEEYVKALKQQADDVEGMLSKMHCEFKDLQEEYEVELEAIEGAFMAER